MIPPTGSPHCTCPLGGRCSRQAPHCTHVCWTPTHTQLQSVDVLEQASLSPRAEASPPSPPFTRGHPPGAPGRLGAGPGCPANAAVSPTPSWPQVPAPAGLRRCGGPCGPPGTCRCVQSSHQRCLRRQRPRLRRTVQQGWDGLLGPPGHSWHRSFFISPLSLGLPSVWKRSLSPRLLPRVHFQKSQLWATSVQARSSCRDNPATAHAASLRAPGPPARFWNKAHSTLMKRPLPSAPALG